VSVLEGAEGSEGVESPRETRTMSPMQVHTNFLLSQLFLVSSSCVIQSVAGVELLSGPTCARQVGKLRELTKPEEAGQMSACKPVVVREDTITPRMLGVTDWFRSIVQPETSGNP
jgi:hypothetical protein